MSKPEQAPPGAAEVIGDKELQSLWDQARVCEEKAHGFKAAAATNADDAKQLRERLALVEEERRQNLAGHKELTGTAATLRALIDNWCATHPEARPPADPPEPGPQARPDVAPVCVHPHCAQAITRNGEGWVHMLSARRECDPGDPLTTTVATPTPAGDVRAASGPPPATAPQPAQGNGAAS